MFYRRKKTLNLPRTNRKEYFLMAANSRLQRAPALPNIFSNKKWKIKAMESVQREELRGFPKFSFLSNRSKNALVLEILGINVFPVNTCAVCSR